MATPATPFWAPFPGTVELLENNFDADIVKLDAAVAPRLAADGSDANTAIKIQAKAVPADRSYKMKIKGFRNPFSLIAGM